MILRVLILFALISFAKCRDFGKTRDLHVSLRETDEFFQKLKQDYEVPNGSSMAEIDVKIAEHMKSTKNRTRSRRAVSLEKGIMVLDGFQDVLSFAFKDVRDISFFAMETNWFAGVVDAEGLSLFQFNDKTLNPIGTHRHNYTRIIAEYCENGVLLILTTDNGAIEIFRLMKNSNNYTLQPIQDFVFKDVTDLTSWHGMNELYLGVATTRDISIYTWLGEHFDLIQILNAGAQKLVPFYSKGFMHIVATGHSTVILRHSLRTNNFEIVQRLKSARDASSFHVQEEHHNDHFLCLSSEESSVVYKEIHDRFMPFQKIDLARNSLAVVLDKTIVLLSVDKRTLNVYQYDGWRFVKLNIKIDGVEEIRRTRVFDEEFLLMNVNGSSWKLTKMSWTMKKSWKTLQDEIKQWCEEAKAKAKRVPMEITEFKGPLRILSGHVGTLTANEINGHDANESLDILTKIADISSKLNDQKKILSAKKWPKDPIFDTLKAKKVNIKCNSTCKAAQLNVKKSGDPFQKSRTSQEGNGILKYKRLRIKDSPTLPCPLPSFSTENLMVTGLTNAESFQTLERDLLKVSGDQEITGEHTVQSMNVTRLVAPLDMAAKSSKQMIEIETLRVKELNLTEGGFLLPLNGSVTVIPGSIKAARVRLTKLPILRGSLKGLENFTPSILEMAPLQLKGDYNLQNIVIEDFLNASAIVSKAGKSLKSILDNSVSLEDTVPVNLEVSAKNMNWENVTVPIFGNLVTANSKDTVRITGRKHVPRNITVTKDIYEKLKLPKIEGELCGVSVSAPELKTPTLRINDLIATRINASNIIGQLKKYDVPRDYNFSRNESHEKLRVTNLKVKKVNGIALNDMQMLLNKLEGTNLYKGSLKIENVSVDVLKGPVNFVLPSRINEIISTGNIYVGNVNGVDLKEFLSNAVTIHDAISFENVSFDSGLSSDHLYASHLPFNPQTGNLTFVWGTKTIFGDLKTRSIDIPRSFDYESSEPVIISIEGSAKFLTEPSIENVNDNNVKALIEKSWMKDRSTIFKGSNLHLENITVRGKAISQKNVSAPNAESWKDLGNRVLSKSKLQEIKVPISLNEVEVPFILGTAASNVKSEVPELNDMLENALTDKGPQKISGQWNFHALNITVSTDCQGKVNELDLARDVVRHDADENIVAGRKRVLDLSTKELYGLGFGKWASQVFTENRRKLITIKGRKTFERATLQNLSVFGTVMGKRIEDALLKSTDQTMRQRTIEGNMEVPGLIIDGLINDVNLTEIIKSQLKKENPSQVVASDIEFAESLNVYGNVTVSGPNKQTGATDVDEGLKKDQPDELIKVSEAIDAIKVALDNRAIYVNKFEFVPSSSIHLTIANESKSALRNNCEFTNSSSLICNNKQLPMAVDTNDPDFILTKWIVNEKTSYIVSVKRNEVSIFTFDVNQNQVHPSKKLSIPGIKEAMAEPLKDSLQIILQLPSQTLLLRYESSQELEEYVLPESEVLHTVRTPTNELLLILSDGIWSLEGSGEARKLASVHFKGQIQSFTQGSDLFIKSVDGTNSTLLRARYFGH